MHADLLIRRSSIALSILPPVDRPRFDLNQDVFAAQLGYLNAIVS
jgi:hypothetical protein